MPAAQSSTSLNAQPVLYKLFPAKTLQPAAGGCTASHSQPAAGAAAAAAAATAAALLWKDMQMGGTTLAMDRMHEGMVHRPSPAISPDAAAGTCIAQRRSRHTMAVGRQQRRLLHTCVVDPSTLRSRADSHKLASL